ncbi:MAG: hypothetical protein COA78_21560 [Blastopirellula sp.]|nr:MAG: hypothetical protein COA78_21560 [Blastopirellula sp.]
MEPIFKQAQLGSIDRMICNPSLREEFLALARPVCHCNDEQNILWGLMGLRKKKAISKAIRKEKAG